MKHQHGSPLHRSPPTQGQPRMGFVGFPHSVYRCDSVTQEGGRSAPIDTWRGSWETTSFATGMMSLPGPTPAPPPGFGPPQTCSTCFALGSDLASTKKVNLTLNAKCSTLAEEHSRCSVIAADLENITRKYNDLLKENEDHVNCPAVRLAHEDLSKKHVELLQKYEELQAELEKTKDTLKNTQDLVKAFTIQLELIQNPQLQENSLPSRRLTVSDKGSMQVTATHTITKPVGNIAVHATQTTIKPVGNIAVPEDVVEEIHGDLFDAPEEYSLAHCVGGDFLMSSGIAIEFRRRFRRIDTLLEQNKVPGDVAYLIDENGRYIFYLVTKWLSTDKPTWDDFTKSVKILQKLCLGFGVKHLAMPRIGCGLDRLLWTNVKSLLNQEFAGTGIKVQVYLKESQSEVTVEQLETLKWNLRLVNSITRLVDLNSTQCAIVFFASTDGSITEQMKQLNEKYLFLNHFRDNVSKALGHLYHFKSQRGANLFGLVMKRREDEHFSFQRMSECLPALKKLMKKSDLYCIGLEAFKDSYHHHVMHKIWTLLLSLFFFERFEVVFCWPDGVKEDWEDSVQNVLP